MHNPVFPRPAVTTDIVIFSIRDGELKLLLIKRRGAPFKGRWALPGGFVRLNESLEAAANRELAEETGVPLPITSLTRQMFQAALAQGHGEEDFCSSIKVLESLAGIELQKNADS